MISNDAQKDIQKQLASHAKKAYLIGLARGKIRWAREGVKSEK